MFTGVAHRCHCIMHLNGLGAKSKKAKWLDKKLFRQCVASGWRFSFIIMNNDRESIWVRYTHWLLNMTVYCIHTEENVRTQQHTEYTMQFDQSQFNQNSIRCAFWTWFNRFNASLPYLYECSLFSMRFEPKFTYGWSSGMENGFIAKRDWWKRI